MVPESPQEAKVHSYVGASSKHKENLPTFGRVSWIDIYPGIDLMVASARGGFAYQFVVSPGADVSSHRHGLVGRNFRENFWRTKRGDGYGGRPQYLSLG